MSTIQIMLDQHFFQQNNRNLVINDANIAIYYHPIIPCQFTQLYELKLYHLDLKKSIFILQGMLQV